MHEWQASRTGLLACGTHRVAEAKPVGFRRCPATVGTPALTRVTCASQAALRDASAERPSRNGDGPPAPIRAPTSILSRVVRSVRARWTPGKEPLVAPNARRIVAACLSLAVVLMLPASASAALTDQQRAERGTGFIAGMQRPNGSIPAFSPIGSTADAVLAFVATGSGRPAMSEALGYLRRQVAAGNVTGVGLQAKVVMAASAVGRDPRTFGGTNLLQAIRSQIGNDGHIDDAAVFDQALGVLAIEAAGVKPATSRHHAGCWTRSAPTVGGPTMRPTRPAPTTTTATTVRAPTSSPRTRTPRPTSCRRWRRPAAHRGASDPFAFFETVRDPDHGGWSYSTAFIATDANSTGLVLQAYVAGGDADPDRRPEVVAHVAVPGVRRVGLHVGRRRRRATPTWEPRSARSRRCCARRSR